MKKHEFPILPPGDVQILGIDSGEDGGVGWVDAVASTRGWSGGAIPYQFIRAMACSLPILAIHELPVGPGRSNGWKTFSHAYRIIGALEAAGHTVVVLPIHPATWQGPMGVMNQGKEASIRTAEARYNLAGLTEHEADALLMATWARDMVPIWRVMAAGKKAPKKGRNRAEEKRNREMERRWRR